MSDFLHKLVKLLGVLIAIPFLAYGVVGLLTAYNVDDDLANYVGLVFSTSPIRWAVYIAIGLLIVLGMKVLAERIK
jgi:uncharacterized membrane protein